MAEMGAGANGALDISLMKKIFYNCLAEKVPHAPLSSKSRAIEATNNKGEAGHYS
jgi:hypothetical protein